MKSTVFKIAIAAAILVVCMIGAFRLATKQVEQPKRDPVTASLLVDVVQPRVKQGAFTVSAQGTVTPRIETELVSEVSGKVIWISDAFVAGGSFRAGEELARIDPSDYETALLAAEAELAAARATLADEQARSDAAREDFRRLYGDSREPSDLLLRLPQVARAKAAVQAQEAAVARARRDLDRTRLRLPFDGMVRERNIDLGQFVTTGASLGAAFGTERAEVRLPVSDNDLAFLGITPGAPPRQIQREITLIGSVGGALTSWPATLVRTEGVVDRNTRLSYVVGEIRDPYALAQGTTHRPLPMGTYVEANIPGRDASGLLVLPSEAVHQGDQVYRADADDKLDVITVDIVRSTPREVYVRGDLSVEDRIVI
ncbi:MAG: efflux RND transporter periplasmic adaptor subunit, partial [Wenzhouxiangellaceae bacterium]